MLDLALTVNIASMEAIAEQEFLDLAFAHASLEQDVGMFFLGQGIHYLSADSASGRLQALPLYGVEKVYVIRSDLDCYGLTLTDLAVKPQVLEQDQLSHHLITAKQLVHWGIMTSFNRLISADEPYIFLLHHYQAEADYHFAAEDEVILSGEAVLYLLEQSLWSTNQRTHFYLCQSEVKLRGLLTHFARLQSLYTNMKLMGTTAMAELLVQGHKVVRLN